MKTLKEQMTEYNKFIDNLKLRGMEHEFRSYDFEGDCYVDVAFWYKGTNLRQDGFVVSCSITTWGMTEGLYKLYEYANKALEEY